MKIRKAGETKLMKEDLIAHGIVFVDEKSINGKFRKLDRIALTISAKTNTPPSHIVTEQKLTNNGMFFTIRDKTKFSDSDLQDVLKTIYRNSHS